MNGLMNASINQIVLQRQNKFCPMFTHQDLKHAVLDRKYSLGTLQLLPVKNVSPIKTCRHVFREDLYVHVYKLKEALGHRIALYVYIYYRDRPLQCSCFLGSPAHCDVIGSLVLGLPRHVMSCARRPRVSSGVLSVPGRVSPRS